MWMLASLPSFFTRCRILSNETSCNVPSRFTTCISFVAAATADADAVAVGVADAGEAHAEDEEDVVARDAEEVEDDSEVKSIESRGTNETTAME